MANVKDGDGVLWLLDASELVSVVPVCRLRTGSMICRLSGGQSAERFEKDL